MLLNLTEPPTDHVEAQTQKARTASSFTKGPVMAQHLLSGSENAKGFRIWGAEGPSGQRTWIADVSPVIKNDRGDASDEGWDNAILIKETFNVATETGLTPRQLAERSCKLDRILSLLKNLQLPHGTCQPRSRQACTKCNAQDELDAMVSEFKGTTLRLSGTYVSDAPENVIDGSR